VLLEIHVAVGSHVEVMTAIGDKGTRSERVAAQALAQAQAYMRAGAPVGEHLADQVLLLAALAGKGAFLTVSPTQHTRTQIEVIRRFLEVRIGIERHDDAYVLSVG
jgi:RNA 3'-terminal phosphate cyclase (ATP)